MINRDWSNPNKKKMGMEISDKVKFKIEMLIHEVN